MSPDADSGTRDSDGENPAGFGARARARPAGPGVREAAGGSEEEDSGGADLDIVLQRKKIWLRRPQRSDGGRSQNYADALRCVDGRRRDSGRRSGGRGG